MGPKRRLPLLQPTGDDDAPHRAPWQWVGFGAVAIFVVWLPLAAAIGTIGSRVVARWGSVTGPEARRILAAASALGFGVATFAGSFMVGRWGGTAAGVREGILSGLVAVAVVALAVTLTSPLVPGAHAAVLIGLLVIALLALPFAALGGKLGRRARR